jgi:tRNA dimethylallyltransferase
MDLLALVGPTASGKTGASVELARWMGAEIVAVDSMLVYRGMDVGTAKPTSKEREAVPHHLVDVAEPDEPFSVVRYQSLAREAIAGMRERGRRPLLVGGTGLYFRAVADDLEFPGTDPALRRTLETEAASLGPARMHGRLEAIDPAAAAKIEVENVRRTVRALEVIGLTGRAFSSFAAAWDRYPAEGLRVAGVRIPPAILAERIERRVEAMVAEGLVGEVQALLERGFERFLTASQAIGYLEVVEHLRGRITLDEATDRTIRRTRALARRQMAWFRRDPRVRWFDAGAGGAEEVADDIAGYLGGKA